MGKYFAIGCVGILAVLLLVAVVLGLNVSHTYNDLVIKSQAVDKSWADVNVQYQRRSDLIPNFVNTVSGEANFEKSTLTEVTQARASVGQVKIDASKAPEDAQQFAQFQGAQNQLSSALSHLLVVTERYPTLQANASFRNLEVELEGTENRISVTRDKFNGVTQDYDTAIKRFPTVIYASMLGFNYKPYFESTPGSDKAPTVNFNFGGASPSPAQ